MTFELDTLIKFTPKSVMILGNEIIGTIISIEKFDKAVKNSKRDLTTTHQTVYNNIGEFNIPDIRNSKFLELKLKDSDETVYFATDWINADTIETLTTIPQTTVTFTNITTEQLDGIKSYLRLKGIMEYSII